jgi:hypothetical protein
MPITPEHAYNNYLKHLEKMNEKYKTNREDILNRNKRYFEANKEDIIRRMTEKIHCPTCNVMISRGNMHLHKKTQKHTSAFKQ